MMNGQNKRERLVDSAATLFHQVGMTATSLADIAKHADIPIGNVYYYFKTKEELAMAAISKRREQFKAGYALLEDGIADPRQRLVEATTYYHKVRDEYTRYGCPIGKIIYDADTDKDPVAQEASGVLADFSAWAERQFTQLGHTQEAARYAGSLIAGIQGAILAAKAFRNAEMITDETNRLVAWIEGLPNRRISLGKVGMRAPESAMA